MAGDISFFQGACWYGVFLFSTTLHEASHAFAAMKLGDYTAYHAGQVSLDPIPHIRREPFGMVVVPLLFYFFIMPGSLMGWASAPYDPDWERRYPRRAGIMAMAGPLSNLLLVVAAVVLIKIGVALKFFELAASPYGSSVAVALNGGLPHFAATILSILFSLNLLLFVFNLLPVPPLDGSNFPLLFLSPSAANTYIQYLRHPTFALIGVIIGWRIFPHVFNPMQYFVTDLAFG